MQKVSKSRGITLISLVITIIILIILAGVTIGLINGNDGILSKTKLAKWKYQNSANDENGKINTYENEIDKFSIDVASSRNNNVSSDIDDFTIETTDINATYITIKVSKIKSSVNIFGYIAVLNGKPIDFTKEQEYSFTNLNKNTNYNMELVAIDENIKIKYSNKLTGKTTSRLYLYNRGNECIPVTGGWSLGNAQNGRSQKNSDNILLYYSNVGYSDSNCVTNKIINLQNFSKIYIVYNKTNATPNGSTWWTYLVTTLGKSNNFQNGSYVDSFDLNNFNNKFSITDSDAYDYIYEIYAE